MRDYTGDFEVHLTVRVESPESLQAFIDWCDRRQVKCVRIVLARGDHVEQPMATWHQRETNLPAVLDEANCMAHEAEAEHLIVTRVKVEASPHNQDVPVQDGDAANHPEQNYFEHHVKIQRHADAAESELVARCMQHGAHLSRNAFRQSIHGMQQRFVTLRSYGVGWETSRATLEELLKSLAELQEETTETESEYCVYDSNVGLDNGWLSG